MCLADVGDEAIVGVGNFAEEVDFSRMAGTHLHDGNLGVRLDAQQSKWHANVVVEVAHRVDDVVFFCQNRRDKLFCGGLSVGTRDAEYRGLALLTVVGGQVL